MPRMRACVLLCALAASAWPQTGSIGIFTSSTDVGAPPLKGPDFAAYRAAHPVDTLVGAGLSVQAPLGEWVTIARSGQSAPRGSYSSDAASQRPRLLQLRVTAP